MEKTVSSCIDDILKKTSEGQGTFPELAEALRALEGMNLIVPPGDFVRFTQDLTSAVESKGYGKVTTKDAESPRVVGLTTQDGAFVPRVFTSNELAREYAVTSGIIQPDENLITQSTGWVAGLHNFLAQGYAGVIIDSGTEHQVNLERKPLARLLALMSLEEFAGLDSIHVVTFREQVFVQREADKPACAFVFDHPGAAQWGVTRLQQQNSEAGAVATSTRLALETLLRHGVETLIVNPHLGDERFYTREEMLHMVEILGGDPDAAAAPAQVDPALQTETSQRATTGEAELPSPLQKALEGPDLPMVAPPRLSDAENRARFEAWKEPMEKQTADPWQFIEALAYGMHLYVPLHFRNVEGLHWPQFFRHPSDPKKTVVYFFTEEERVRKALSTSPPESQQYRKLSGLEALRWAWACPANINEFGVDWPDPDTSILFPSLWALMPFYPMFMDARRTDRIPKVGLAKLARLGGARALKPQVAHCLTQQWKRLVGVEPGNGGACLVNHRGASWWPAFTDVETYAAFKVARGEAECNREAPYQTAPFLDWLARCTEQEGVILDPDGPNPLTLDRAELLILGVWASKGGQPDAYDIIQEAGRLRNQDKISEQTAGRIAGSIACYRAGSQPMDNGGVQVLQIPDSDTGILFTDNHSAETYLRFYRQMGLISEAMQQVNLFSRWDQSPLETMSQAFTEGVWINPDPMGHAGLRLGPEGLEAAVAETRRRLRPRVPGFTVNL